MCILLFFALWYAYALANSQISAAKRPQREQRTSQPRSKYTPYLRVHGTRARRMYTTLKSTVHDSTYPAHASQLRRRPPSSMAGA